MDKKITIAIIAIIVAVVAIGAYFGLANTFIPIFIQPNHTICKWKRL